MGVAGFFPFLASKAPAAVCFLDSPDLVRGKRLGLDAPAVLHRARAAWPYGLSYVTYLAERLLWLRDLSCTPLFVFDGEQARAAKLPETGRREARRKHEEELHALWLERQARAESWEEAELCRCHAARHARGAARVGAQERAIAQQLLDALGLRWCVAPGEAECYLATLQLTGRIDEIVTEDSDALVCGATSIIRNFWGLAESGGAQPAAASPSAWRAQKVTLLPLLTSLGIDQHLLRTAAVLAGCDFAPKLRNVGLVKALRAATACSGDLEASLRALGKTQEAEDAATVEAFETARALLSDPDAQSAVSDLAASSGAVSERKLALLLSVLEAAGDPGGLRIVLAPPAPPVPLRDLLPRGTADVGAAAQAACEDERPAKRARAT